MISTALKKNGTFGEKKLCYSHTYINVQNSEGGMKDHCYMIK